MPRLHPTEYSIDAHGVFAGDALPNDTLAIAKAVALSCEMHGFAVVRNTFEAAALADLRIDSEHIFAEHVAQQWAQSFDSSVAQKMSKTSERYTDLSDTSMQTLGAFATALHVAADEYPRLATPDSIIDAAFITSYSCQGRVAKHRDSHNTGVVCDTAVAGRGLMGFWHGWRKVAEAIVRPNDTVVTPAITCCNPHVRRLVKHDVIDISASYNDGSELPGRGGRMTVVYNYGRHRAS